VKETRIVSAPVEVRGEGEGTATIAGYACLYNQPYEVWGFREIVAPGAFTKTLKERGGYDTAVVWSHDADRVLGTVESDTARVFSDDDGLRYEADLDLLDPDGMSAFRKITTGKVRQSSFSFEIIRDEWEYPESEENSRELPVRTIHEVRLWECSPCLWGANPETVVDVARAARSLAVAADVDEAAAAEALAQHDLSTLKTTGIEPESREDATETPDDAPPEGAPVATSPPEPARKFRPVLPI
jgi:HK97 family phage prohead protease